MTTSTIAKPDFSLIKTIIFDFDGTMIDTLDILVDAYNALAPRFRCRLVSRAEQAMLRGRRPQEFFHEYHISLWKLPLLVRDIRKSLKKLLWDTEIGEPTRTLLHSLQQKGYRLGILSSNTEEAIRHILAKHDLEQFFDFVVTGNNLFGKDRAMKKLLRRKGLRADEVVYVGDETRDVEAMHRLGVPIVAVGWGYAAPELLQKLVPTYLAHSIEELETIFS